MTGLDASFAACRRITRQANSSFPIAFRLLPADQRRGMDALYAWLRIVDDIADGNDSDKRERLREWQSLVVLSPSERSAPVTLRVAAQQEILPAFRATVEHFHLREEHLLAVLDGVASDLEPRTFATFDELSPYCYRVASVVGFLCLSIWGVDNPAANAPAEAAGIAFQLTNILRDLGEDRGNGRVYLPLEDLTRFDCHAKSWSDTPAFRRLMQFQIDRAKHYYKLSEPLLPLLPPPARAMFGTMTGIYRELLDEIERHPAAVLTRRLRVNRLKKLSLLATNYFFSNL
ncbi:phytoene/squalene synthase family protein [soil metagenome]